MQRKLNPSFSPNPSMSLTNPSIVKSYFSESLLLCFLIVMGVLGFLCIHENLSASHVSLHKTSNSHLSLTSTSLCQPYSHLISYAQGVE